MNINKHGLSRTVPDGVKRKIRQRCGFGCVICGKGFYDYEHFEPDFCDAHEHNPEGMTLLCSQCNQKRARHRLSASTVAKADKNPRCLQQGFANEMFDFDNGPLEVIFGGVRFYDCNHLIAINGKPIFSVEAPINKHSPILLSGVFCDAVGRESLLIKENEWMVHTGNWDVECEGARIIIRSAPRQISLNLRMCPPEGIVIEKLDMLYEGVWLKGNDKELSISPDGKNWYAWSGCDLSHCEIGIDIRNKRSAANDPEF